MWKIIATCGVVIMLILSASGVTLTLNALVWTTVYQLMTEMETEK